jgi:hypothetical protein
MNQQVVLNHVIQQDHEWLLFAEYFVFERSWSTKLWLSWVRITMASRKIGYDEFGVTEQTAPVGLELLSSLYTIITII